MLFLCSIHINSLPLLYGVWRIVQPDVWLLILISERRATAKDMADIMGEVCHAAHQTYLSAEQFY
jgi:hypothetical protein